MATEKKSYYEIEKNKEINISYMELLNTLEWEEKRKIIINRDNNQCKSCSSKDNLHVHHKEYIVGKLPWDYDDFVFMTLCAECHNSLHCEINTFIPIYILKEGRKVLFNGTPCTRCGGKGYLPQHKKIENGICFRCRGRKFEEMLTIE